MKKRDDPRHLKRIQLMQELFAWNVNRQIQYTEDTNRIIKSLREIDKLIQQSASQRPLEQINKIDLAILRLIVFELIIEKDAPIKVVIDEAVELGKEYGAESSPAFINGVIGQLLKLKKIQV